MTTSKISIILPTYNEKDTITILLSSIHDAILDYDHEIIVVDDNSSN